MWYCRAPQIFLCGVVSAKTSYVSTTTKNKFSSAVCGAGRFMIGFFMGAETVMFRTYVGETSSTVIAAMPPEKREKSTLKYTVFFVAYTVCCLSGLSGPG